MQTPQTVDHWDIHQEHEDIIKKMFELCNILLERKMDLLLMLKEIEEQQEEVNPPSVQAAAADEQ